jgi:hypothetical protein
VVPLDKTKTMLIEPRHISETEGMVTLDPDVDTKHQISLQ